MSPHDGPRHDRTITQSDPPAPAGAPAPPGGQADDETYDAAYDEYGEALYDDPGYGDRAYDDRGYGDPGYGRDVDAGYGREVDPVEDDEVVNAGWSMWDDGFGGPRHGPPSQPTAATGPARSDAYRTGGAGAVRTPGPPTPATGQGAAVGAHLAAPAASRRPLAIAGAVALWAGCLGGGLMIGAASGGDGGEPEGGTVTVDAGEAESDWRDAAVPGGPPTSPSSQPGDDPTERPEGEPRPTTTERPDVTRPSTTTTTEREPSGGTTTTTEEQETTTTSSSTTTSTTAPSTTTTTAPTTTTPSTTAQPAALRSFLPF